MSDQVVFERRIPIRHEVDVMVAGGGPSGMAAAVTAARQGKSVYLAEGHTCFGGMGTAALLPVFCQLTDGIHFVSAPFGEEVYHRLHDLGGCQPGTSRSKPGGSAAIRAEALKRVYDDMAAEAKFQFTFHTRCIGLEQEGGHIRHVVCQGKSGPFAVRAAVFIDCTGNGDLAAWAGAPFEKGDSAGEMQPGTLCSTWTDIDWEAVHKSRMGQSSRLEEAWRDHVFTIDDRHLPGMFRNGEHLGGGNLGHAFGLDGTDERSITRALIEGRKLQLEFENYYKHYLKGYEAMRLAATGSLMGVRETRRIFGDYVLNEQDFIKRAVFEDEIGRYCYPVDVHASRPDAASHAEFEKKFYKELRYKPGETYGIPYRILTPRGLENLLVAGRCVSTDRSINGSLRVMPGGFITGQAAGMAAAMAVERQTTTRGIAVRELQRRLKKSGAWLPNCA